MQLKITSLPDLCSEPFLISLLSDKVSPMELQLLTESMVLTPLTTADVELAVEMFTDADVTKFIGGVMSEDAIRKEISTWTKRGGDGCIGI